VTNLIIPRALFSPTYLLHLFKTGISAIRFADPENPILEPNTAQIGRSAAEIWPFEISPIWAKRSVGRWSPVGPQYILLLTLFSYTPLRYVRNIAREE